MGLYDREYAQDDRPGVQLQMPQSLTMQLVLINVAVYLAQTFGGDQVTGLLCLTSDWFQRPWEAYRLLSYGFLHSTRDIFHILMNMFVLWMFGREVEVRYGRREFLWFYLSAIVMAGLFWSVSEALNGTQAILVGASGGTVAVFVLFALTWPQRKMVLIFLPFYPIPAWVMAAAYVAYDAYGAMYRSSNVAFTAHLAGAVFALYYFKFNFSPGRWLADKFAGASVKRGPKLRVHVPDAAPDEDEQDQVDEILRKIQREGQDSLTRRERQTLERASREYQRRNRRD